jgi:hypothetical protein
MSLNFMGIRNGVSFGPQSATPTSPVNGDIYYDSTRNTFVEYINGNWMDTQSRTDVATAANLTSANFTATVVQSSLVRLTGSTQCNVNGLVASSDAKQVLLYNESSAVVTIVNQSATEGTAANRIICLNGANLTLSAGQSVLLGYDSSQARWVVLSTPSSGGSGGAKNYLSAITTSQSTTPNTGNGNFELGSSSGWSLAHSTLASLIPTSLASAGTPFDSTHGGTAATALALNVEGVVSLTPTATWSSGTNQITVSSATGIVVGQVVTNPGTGTGFPTGTIFVQNISGTTIFLNKPTTGTQASASNMKFAFAPLAGSFSASVSTNSNTANLSSTAGDMLISSAFNIDNSSQNSIMSFSFSYEDVSDGALLFPGTSAGSFAIWIYDVTNAAWIQPAGVYSMVQASGIGIASGTFQTSSNSTQYQIAIININATASLSYDIWFDDFTVGPVTANAGLISTPNTFTVLTSGTGTYTPPTGTYQIKVRAVGGGSGGAGTGSGSSGGNGNSGGVTTFAGGSLSLTANPGSVGTSATSTHAPGGTATGGSVNITGGIGGPRWANTIAAPGGPGGASPLGAGGAAGEANQTQGNAAEGFGGGGGGAGCSTTSTPSGGGAGGSGYCEAVVNLSTVGATSFSYAVGGAGGGGGAGTSGVPGGQGSPGVIIIEEFYYGSNVQVSAAAATNGPAIFNASAVSATGTINSSATLANVIFSAFQYDNYSGYNSGTGNYTVPATGYYFVSSTVVIQATTTTGYQLNILHNGSQIAINAPSQASSSRASASISCIIFCSAGDTLSAATDNAIFTGSATYLAGSQNFSIMQIPNSQQALLATASVNARYTFNGNTALPNNTLETLSSTYATYTKIRDTHNAFNTSTGVYTVPISGMYRVSLRTGIQATTATTGVMQNAVQQGGSSSLTSFMNAAVGNSPTNATEAQLSDIFLCNAGDTLTLQALQNNGSSIALVSVAGVNSFSIERVGN